MLQVNIGKNTRVTSRQFDGINWSDEWQATRDLAVAVFGKHELATHSLTGTKSNASSSEPKTALDPVHVADMMCMYSIFDLS
jgi:hypothetical protein